MKDYWVACGCGLEMMGELFFQLNGDSNMCPNCAAGLDVRPVALSQDALNESLRVWIRPGGVSLCAQVFGLIEMPKVAHP